MIQASLTEAPMIQARLTALVMLSIQKDDPEHK